MKILLFVFIIFLSLGVSAQSNKSEKTTQPGTMDKKTTTNMKDSISENVPVLQTMSGKADAKNDEEAKDSTKAVPVNAAKKEENE